MLAPVSEANERAVYQSMADGCRAALQVSNPFIRNFWEMPCSQSASHGHERTVCQFVADGCRAALQVSNPVKKP